MNWQGHKIKQSGLFSPGKPFYLTVFTRRHAEIFSDNAAGAMLVNVLTYNRFALDYRVLGFVIMPDHLHIIFLPGKVPANQVIMKNIANFTRYYQQLIQKRIAVWEDEYCHMPIENGDMLDAVQKHMHTNPVRNRLVAESRCYKYSSCRFYEENDRQDFQLLLDLIEAD